MNMNKGSISALVVSLVLAFLGGLGCGGAKSEKGEKDKPYLGRPLSELLDQLKDPDAKVRLAAVTALGHGTTKEGVPGLCQALDDPEPSVAEEAAKGLRRVGPDAEAAVPTLVKRLKDPPTEGFRQAAIAALGRIGPKAASSVPLLVEHLGDKKAPVTTRQTIIAALGGMGPAAKAAVPDLIDALAERELEQAAIAALIQMGKEARPAVPALSKRLQPERPQFLELVRLLAELDPQAAKAALPDLRSLADSAPVGDKGIVNFRASQRRIEEARELLKKLE